MLKIFIGDHIMPTSRVARKYARKNGYEILDLDTTKSLKAQKPLIMCAYQEDRTYIIATVQSPLLNFAAPKDIYIVDNDESEYNLADIAPGLTKNHNIEKLYLGGRFDELIN